MDVYRILAFLMLLLHLFWLLWVLLGWMFTRRRTLLRWVHIACVVYGIGITLAHYPCPLTLAEQSFQARAGHTPYEKTFLEHYVELLVYPDVPVEWLTWGGVVVCTAILSIYLWRFRRRTNGQW